MRRRLVTVSLATTLLVVIALVVPLGLLVRRQASERARVAAEIDAQSAASLVALAMTLESDGEAIESAAGPLEPGVVVMLADGTTFGSSIPGQGSLISIAGSEQATVAGVVAGGWEVAVPVIGANGVSVVDAFVTDAELTEGVAAAWALLGLLGVFLVVVAVFVADRLGRRMVGPIRDLAGAAHLMSEGHLDARVASRALSEAPPEIVEVGVAFNNLSSRLDELLIEEREAVADLSHRLRTPMTSLRLQAEKIDNHVDRQSILDQVERVEEAIDRLIESSRGRDAAASGTCQLDEVVRERSLFWRVLAEEQNRVFGLDLNAGAAELGVPAEEMGVVVDTLIGNVFSHTPAGTSFRLATGEDSNRPWVEVADSGPGFKDHSLLTRGVSGHGSTGLGLDIVRQAAEATGGHLDLNEGPDGGAVVRVWFG